MRAGRPLELVNDRKGMSVIEIMVGICIVGILAAVAIPAYITYVQQARVISLVMPRLHQLESNISLFYIFNNRLPGEKDLAELIENIDTENLEIDLASGAITITIRAGSGSKLNILDGTILVASPVIGAKGLTSWRLDGELADRLKISS